MATADATAAIFRRSWAFLALLVPLVVVGFWPSYFTRVFAEPEWRVHVHGFAMFAWVALVIGQALLIRTGRRDLHRRIGSLSYVLAPLIVLSTLSLAHLRLNASLPEPPADLLYFFYVQVALLAVFAIAWSLGIANRRRPLVHARFMLCTALTLIDPIVARILYNLFGIENPASQILTYGLTGTILVGLILFERRHATGSRVFAGMLAVFVVALLPTFFLPATPAWRAFAVAFAGLPLP